MAPAKKRRQLSAGDAPPHISHGELRLLRMQAQRLALRERPEALVDVVRSLCGVNAQLPSAMLLALRARVADLKVEDVQEAISRDRSLVRTWAMRGTLHLLAAQDVGWLVSLLGPVFIAKGAGRRAELGLDPATVARGLTGIQALLSHAQPLRRAELVDGLIAQGLAIEKKSQAPYHLMGYAGLKGMICFGPDQDGEPTLALLESWIGRAAPVSREAALAELVHRYLAGYGPATPHDFAAWSGLTVTDARLGWALAREGTGLAELQVEDQVLGLPAGAAQAGLAAHPPGPLVRLLPAFDTYLLGYAGRDDVVPPAYQSQVFHGGQIVPVVLVDGLAAGVWRHERREKRLSITVRPFEAFEPAVQRLIAEEADDIGRFFDLAPVLSYTGDS